MSKFLRVVKVTHDANEMLRLPCVISCRKIYYDNANSRFLYWVEPLLSKNFAPGYVEENSYLCELQDGTWLPMSENDYLKMKELCE